MSSNDNFPQKYNPLYTGTSRGVTSYLNRTMIVLASGAVRKYDIDEMRSADLFIDQTPQGPEAWMYFYHDHQTGKFKINFLGRTARISVKGFANYFDLELPKLKSAPFDLRKITVNPPIDQSFKVLPDLALAFTWPEIEFPAPRKNKKSRKKSLKGD